MNLTGTNERLNAVVEDRAKETFHDPDTVEESAALGVAIARHFGWVAAPIIKTFLAALEDANFHHLREQIEEIARTHELLPIL